MAIRETYHPCAVSRIHWLVVYILFLFFFPSPKVLGQTEGFTVSGTVSDKANGAPIENVNISLRNSQTGTSTNLLGQFNLHIKTLPQFLEFSHIGYEPTILKIEHIPLQAVQVKLSPRPETLPDVVITSQRIDTLFTDQSFSILDFELCDDGMLLLIFKGNLSRSELLLKDYSGNKLLEMKILPMKPLALFKDCLEKAHIISRNKTYQVLIEDKNLTLYPPYDLDYFTKIMTTCKFQIREKVYFEEFFNNELTKRVYYIDTTDNSSHILTTLSDNEKMGFLRQNPENYSIGKSPDESELLNSMRGLASDSAALSHIRNMNATLRFNKMAYLSKIYAPVFSMGDSVVIFNHPSGEIEFYNTDDSLIGTTRITYHLTKKKDSLNRPLIHPLRSNKWLEEVYVDAMQHKAYTAFKNLNGTRDLKEIDLETGRTKYILTIPFPYVMKLQIRDGFVYFIYKGFGENKRKKLFRQKIN